MPNLFLRKALIISVIKDAIYTRKIFEQKKMNLMDLRRSSDVISTLHVDPIFFFISQHTTLYSLKASMMRLVLIFYFCHCNK